MTRELKPGFDRLVLPAPFGVLFRDSFDGRVVKGGLRVQLRDVLSGHTQWLASNGHGVFSAPSVRGWRGTEDEEDSPAFTRSYHLSVVDEEQRFLPLVLQCRLPTRGLLDPEPGSASPAPREPAVPLFSAPTRQLPAGGGVVRAELRRASSGGPAAWARLEVWHEDVLLGEGVADALGRLLVPCRLPPPREPPLLGSPPSGPEGFERSCWDVQLRAWWDAALAEAAAPDLARLRAQPEVPLLRDDASPAAALPPQQLRAGQTLVARGDATPYLWIGA
jgi:hypothetical protein